MRCSKSLRLDDALCLVEGEECTQAHACVLGVHVYLLQQKATRNTGNLCQAYNEDHNQITVVPCFQDASQITKSVDAKVLYLK
jgi:Cft2 family RNA processing exonuclease